MFTGIKVLDLSDFQGAFCSYLLRHVGCEVITIEPPGGSQIRRMEPVYQGEGLWWQAYGRGKESLVLDILDPDSPDRADLVTLIGQADILIHDYTQTQANALRLDYETIEGINPTIVVAAITPFGGDGPKADWPASDLTVWAASGAHYLSGDADRPPVRTSVPQSFQHAGADAAGALLIGLFERNRSGRGQFIDVSAQASSAQAALGANLAIPNGSGYEVQRIAGGLQATFPIQLTWPCKDGYVAVTLLFGPSFDEPNRRLLSWCMEEGFCTQEDVDTQWGQELMAMTAEQKSPEPYFELCQKIEKFTLTHTQQELFEEGVARGIYIAPTFDISGLMTEPHFQAREYWHKLQLMEKLVDKPVSVPGAFAKMSETPIAPPPAAPALNSLSGSPHFTTGPIELPDPSPTDLPLAGLKVLDFMWVIAGPFFTRVLANYGATVIKVESTTRLEPARGAPTFKDAEPGIDRGVPFANFNTDKMSITIDPANPVGQEVLKDLVKWADVVTDSFSPKAMVGWGLGYEDLKTINPDIIMLSSCLMGQTGPRASVAGYGNMAAALSGFYDLTGWQDRSPAGPYLAYTDGVAPRFMLVALMSALEHRRHTGQGQRIDISQAEAAIHFLSPGIFEYGLTGNIWHRAGNRDRYHAPHGVFPTQKDNLSSEGWIAIAVTSDEQWQHLCTALELTELAQDERLKSREGRVENQDQLDDAIALKTQNYDPFELQSKLIAARVPAHVVQNSAQAQVDPQYVHRNHFVDAPHTPTGSMVVENTRFKFSRTPGRVERAGPELGEHNFQVLQDILGYDDDRIADIYASLAME
ncbi:MAG: hypothetical protein GKR90_01285 [Pseudomonadales bacterium]|nr:hypothetical protein [Pseudomonadales bacterium]